MPPFISIIIPVYNSEPFLRECLDSCINQTRGDLEVICVYDHSRDNTLAILREYEAKDPRVRLIIQEENHHLGGARNTGVGIARGRYTWFVDSDDSIFLNSCELLYETVKNNPAAVVRFRAISYKHDADTGERNVEKQDESVFSWPFERMLLRDRDFTRLGSAGRTTVWHYISLTSLVEKYRFLEDQIQEDIAFTPVLFSGAESIYCTDYYLYFRRKNAHSLTGGNFRWGELAVRSTVNSLVFLYDYINENKIGRKHFCYLNFLYTFFDFKKAYKEETGLHTAENRAIIKKLSGKGNGARAFFFDKKRKIRKHLLRLLPGYGRAGV